MRIKAKIKEILNYLASIGLALVFALYLSGRVGWFLVLVFLLAPVISFVMTVVFIRCVTVAGQLRSGIIGKGEVCEMYIRVKNRCFMPSPHIAIEMWDNAYIRCSEKKFYLSIMPLSSEQFTAEFYAQICGNACIGIKSVMIYDYLGLFSFKIKNIDMDKLRGFVKIIPDIADICDGEELVKSIIGASDNADDSEDTVENNTYGFGGFPGYDNREYVPGDPLKRINWKLSAKRNRLLIRLDDEVQGLSVSVVLDNTFRTRELNISNIPQSISGNCAEEELIPLTAQAAIESSLGIVRTLVKLGYGVNYFVEMGSGWEKYVIVDEKGLMELSLALAGYSFTNKEETSRFPYDEIASERGRVSVFCTPFVDNELKNIMSRFYGGKNQLNTLVYSVVKEDGD